jgi:hypothetical protein
VSEHAILSCAGNAKGSLRPLPGGAFVSRASGNRRVSTGTGWYGVLCNHTNQQDLLNI